MLHLGSLVAVVVFFWGDLWRLVGAALNSIRRRSLADPEARLAWGLVIGTVPAAVIGFFFESVFEQLFGMPVAASAFLLGTAVLLIISEVVATRSRPITALSGLDAFVIGLGQTLAIVPGLSRSGATIATALFLGFRREDAARFSFLLAVPITLGSGVYQAIKLAAGGPLTTPVPVILLGLLSAAIAGYLAIAGLLTLVRRRGLIPFAVYCAALGLLVLTGILG
jgi:undecaprenyl-diphosphatase